MQEAQATVAQETFEDKNTDTVVEEPVIKDEKTDEVSYTLFNLPLSAVTII